MSAEAHAAGHDAHHDPVGDRMGMWLFLFTEVLLFGGLFIIYAMYRASFPDAFHTAGKELNPLMGAGNTFVLLTSSLTMALSIVALKRRNRPGSIGFLAATLACGAIFLVVKYFEWSGKISHGLYPGSESMGKLYSGGENIFFGLYYGMTGLHGIHVVIGMILIGVVLGLIMGEGMSGSGASPDSKWTDTLFNVGLYWHLVDLIWIYLFPLFYLIT